MSLSAVLSVLCALLIAAIVLLVRRNMELEAEPGPAERDDDAVLKDFDDEAAFGDFDSKLDLIIERMEVLMQGQAELDQAIADLKASQAAQQERLTAKLAELQAKIDALGTGPDLSAEVADVQAVKSALDAEVATAPAPPAAPAP